MRNINKATSKKAIIGIILSSLCALFLSACDNNTVEEIAETAKPPIETSSIILSEEGIGPIKADSPFNMHQMTVAFNNYSVEEYTLKDSVPTIRISKGVNTIMRIIPDATRQRIFSVIVEDNLIKNGLGHPLGTLYNAIYTYGQDEKCQLGAEDMSGKVLCYAPQYPNILYVFNANTTEIVSAIPPADVLQGWALESIIWRPKS